MDRKKEEEEGAKADHHHHHTHHHHHHHHHAQQPLLCVDKHKIQEAAFCIKDAIDCLIRPHPAPVPNAQWAYKLRLRPLGYLLPWLAIWTLILLTFFERPSWCDADDAADATATATATAVAIDAPSHTDADTDADTATAATTTATVATATEQELAVWHRPQ